MSYDYAAERYDAMLASDRDGDDFNDEPEREIRPRTRYACTDRMCGALDCQTCHPGNEEEAP